MKRRMLIYYSKFSIGGAEMSNIRMMKYLLKDGWSVDLVLKSSGGILENQIPAGVNIHYLSKDVLKYKESDSKIVNILKWFFRNIMQLIIMQRYRFKRYDIAINGFQGLNVYFIAHCVRSNVKLHWIRNDLNGCDPTGRVIKNIKKYSKYIDGYPCVSKTTYDSFVKKAPNLREKAFVFYNFIGKDEMLSKSNEISNPYNQYNPEMLKVVTVCRISDKAKGLFRMLDVYNRLRKEGIVFYWFVIGDGPDFEALKNKIKYLGLEDGFILLGRKENPFPYYRYSDLCATLSYYEGLSGTVNEAKIMMKPVIATRFSGITEQIEHLVNGYIVENNEDAIFDGMKLLLSNKDIRDKISNDILPPEISNDFYKTKLLYDMVEKR